ncbi:MAG: site-specific DNA-methyltransferase [Prevotellaceae bacterium]|jgi:adenine-specific DNA-methyltransferase|nr:site-specific DNA-methyltransferase [Prevotellaceae bacterium]
MPTLNFKGKTFVQNHHLAVKYHQLIPKSELSLTDKVSLHDNLIIHGDNLKALKSLLPNYAGKVKCIYIDPPYNTGNENWVYNDNVNSPMFKEWLGQVVDKEDMTRHEKWLCMMMPRLKLLRELLSEDGAIFISCDDNEQHNLRCLLDELFGEDNFVANIIVRANPRGRQSDNDVATLHDTLLCYAKNYPFLELNGLPLCQEDTDEFDLQDDNGQYWRELGLRQRGSASLREDRQDMYYPLYVNPVDCSVDIIKTEKHTEEVFPKKSDGKDGRWMWGKGKTENEIGRVYAKLIKRRNEYDIFIKDYLERNGIQRTKKPRSIWQEKDVNTEIGGKLLKQIIPNVDFPYPKPIGLINRILRISTDSNSIILDSFAGSGTTAHAVLELNKEDGGNRKFILIEQEDYADTITAERVRRVIKGIPTAKSENLKNGLGGTFSYFDLGPAIELESIMEANQLPSYTEFARYLFYTATGEEFDEKAINEKTGFIGESKSYEVYLIYKPDVEWLKQNALTLDGCRAMPPFRGKQRLVFAPCKYVDDETCKWARIDFCQLPYEIYRLNR